jgi:hypothetical protein
VYFYELIAYIAIYLYLLNFIVPSPSSCPFFLYISPSLIILLLSFFRFFNLGPGVYSASNRIDYQKLASNVSGE